MKYNEIKCPMCGKVFESESYDYVTMWGEDGPYVMACEGCDYTFAVEETVVRTYEYADLRQWKGRQT